MVVVWAGVSVEAGFAEYFKIDRKVTVAAEHEAIVDQGTFDRAQALLATNVATGGRVARQRSNALLAGLLRCASCDAPMLHAFTTRRGRRYEYYVCDRARREGWAACATKSVPARELETLVVDQIRCVGADPGVQERVLTEVRARAEGHEVDAADLRRVLGLWDEVWAALLAKEQARALGRLLERVDYDGKAGTVKFAFRPTGIAGLACEVPA